MRNPKGEEQNFCFHLLFGKLHQKACDEGATFHRIDLDYPAPPQPAPEVRGLGDVVAKAAKLLGFKQKPGCGCKRRQQKLNELMPFKPGGQ